MINEQQTPSHIAIIMDGNGRFAEHQNQPRSFGHAQGAKSLYAIVKHAYNKNIPFLTLFAFSTENWQRPKEEIDFIFNLMLKEMKSRLKELQENGIKIKILGDISKFDRKIQDSIKTCVRLTENNAKMTLAIALNYGGRAEILNAAKTICQKVRQNFIKIEDIDEQIFGKFLYSAEMPEPDLIIRTGGEKRLSNFLLWQSAYSEMVFTDKYWPDFTKNDFDSAISEYEKRVRKYGKIEEIC